MPDGLIAASCRLGRTIALLPALVACGGAPGAPAPSEPVPPLALRYIEDSGFRRATMESQLVSTANAYAFERRRSYALADGWDRLPLEPLAPADLWPDSQAPPDLSALLDLGRRAFFDYPARVGKEFAPGIGQGIPYAKMAADGSGRAVITCATCHVSPAGVVLAPNTALDIGALYVEAFEAAPGSNAYDQLLSWGPGRMDVTADTADDPVRFADLRPVAHQRLLQSAGAIRQRTPVDLAIRLETLLIGSSGRRTRPPRATMAALAWWLHSASAPAPTPPPAPPPSFAERCARCHDPAAGYASADPIPSDDVGTDPAAAWSPGRGTGGYKAPSLVAVGDRSPLLHDASIPDLATLLDPAREQGGHTFTEGLSEAAVADLMEFLGGL